MNNIELLREAIRNSEAGEILARMPRWENYYTQQPLDEWSDLLGPSAVVSTHQEYFGQFIDLWATQEYLIGRLSREQYELLRLAGEGHDIGEAKVGDTPHHQKTESSDKKEFIQALKIIKKLNLPKELRARFRHAFRQVVMGENQPLHLMFKALEKTEYLDTAIRVFDSVQNGLDMPKGWPLIINVLSLDLPKIISVYAQEFPYSIGAYLKNNVEVIDQMFVSVVENLAAPKPEEQRQFANSWRLWQEYTATTREEHLPEPV